MVAEFHRPFGRADDVGEQHRREHPIRVRERPESPSGTPPPG
jgi:hypothetical protein